MPHIVGQGLQIHHAEQDVTKIQTNMCHTFSFAPSKEQNLQKKHIQKRLSITKTVDAGDQWSTL